MPLGVNAATIDINSAATRVDTAANACRPTTANCGNGAAMDIDNTKCIAFAPSSYGCMISAGRRGIQRTSACVLPVDVQGVTALYSDALRHRQFCTVAENQIHRS